MAAGGAPLSPGPTARLIERFPRGPSTPATGGPEGLSGREREVFTVVARGLNDAGTAGTSGPSPLTVKTHAGRTRGEPGARDRAQPAVVGYESGPVTPGSM
ncbi:hypothetical protein GCM10010129_10330 [Streptomyces fumigatiscleroticus]|nr:hypothetical protein GCM10010129_10330 [Streptomyces fumigatiscleroticus]